MHAELAAIATLSLGVLESIPGTGRDQSNVLPTGPCHSLTV